MAHVNLDDRTAESLAAQAAAQGLSIDEYVKHLLRRENGDHAKLPRISADDLDRLIDSEATDTPGLPADFSRADIYADHD